VSVRSPLRSALGFVVPLLSLTLLPSLAQAQEEPTQPAEPHPAGSPAPAGEHAPKVLDVEEEKGEHAEGKEHAEHEEGEEKEPDWEALVDFVGGAATTEAVAEARATGAGAPPPIIDSTRITSYSFLVGLERRLGERITVGARIPLIVADLKSRTGDASSRSTFLVGNLELEGAFVIAKGEHWELGGTLEVALPTSGGKEPPAEIAEGAAPNFHSADRFAASAAASATRGAYETALFAPGRLGIIPKVHLKVHEGGLTVTPMVKVENLLDTTGDAEKSYQGELVGGVRVSYRVARWLEPSANFWATWVFTEKDGFDVLAIEPGLRFPVGPITPQAGVILPLAGHLADDKAWGVRVALGAEF
jgi:hypothetical protein